MIAVEIDRHEHPGRVQLLLARPLEQENASASLVRGRWVCAKSDDNNMKIKELRGGGGS